MATAVSLTPSTAAQAGDRRHVESRCYWYVKTNTCRSLSVLDYEPPEEFKSDSKWGKPSECSDFDTDLFIFAVVAVVVGPFACIMFLWCFGCCPDWCDEPWGTLSDSQKAFFCVAAICCWCTGIIGCVWACFKVLFELCKTVAGRGGRHISRLRRRLWRRLRGTCTCRGCGPRCLRGDSGEGGYDAGPSPRTGTGGGGGYAARPRPQTGADGRRGHAARPSPRTGAGGGHRHAARPSRQTAQSARQPRPLTLSLVHLLNQDAQTCVVCLDRDANSILIPCGHKCVCDTCGQRLKVETTTCPLCRTRFQGITMCTTQI